MWGVDTLAGRVGAAVLGSLCLAHTTLAAPDDRAAAQAPSKLFHKLDADHDGFVTRAEAGREKGFIRAFDEADESHQGRLNADEFVKAESIYNRMLAAAYIDDSIITAKVKAELVKDPLVSALDVGVETYKGLVQLSGFVDNQDQIRRAERIASSVRGVKSVRNSLLVK